MGDVDLVESQQAIQRDKRHKMMLLHEFARIQRLCAATSTQILYARIDLEGKGVLLSETDKEAFALARAAILDGADRIHDRCQEIVDDLRARGWITD